MANSTLHNLNAASSMNATDELYLVLSPFGSGDDRRITFSNFQNSITALGTLTGLTVSGSSSLASLVASGAVTLQSTLGVTGASSFTGDVVANHNLTVNNNFNLNGRFNSNGVSYQFPSADGTSGQQLATNGAGILSWAAAGGLSYGDSISGTTDAGVTITLSNSSADGAAALKLVAGNTQANQPVLANLQLGTSGNVMGLLIQGTGGSTAGAAGTGLNHLTLWADVAQSQRKVLAVGNSVSYTETAYLQADGKLMLFPNAANSLANTSAITIDTSYIDAGGGRIINVANDTAQMKASANDVVLRMALTWSADTLTARTSDGLTHSISRTESRTSGTTADNYALANLTRTQVTTGAGGTLTAAGTVLTLTNSSTQTAGTLTDTVDVLKLTQASISTGNLIKALTGATTMFRVDANGLIYVSTTAGITASTTQTQGNGALTSSLNEVSVVANPNDTVTVPAAAAGLTVKIINNGANTLQIFPASGDNLGAGVNTAVTLAAGSNVVYTAYDATNWEAI